MEAACTVSSPKRQDKIFLCIPYPQPLLDKDALKNERRMKLFPFPETVKDVAFDPRAGPLRSNLGPVPGAPVTLLALFSLPS